MIDSGTRLASRNLLNETRDEMDREFEGGRLLTRNCTCPGDLVRSQRATHTTISVVSFSAECLTDRPVEAPSEVEPLVGHCSTVWIDVQGMHERERILKLLDILAIDEVIEKEIFEERHRAFFQLHKNVLLLVIPVLKMNDSLELQHLGILQVGNTVVTFHEHAIPEIESIKNDVRNNHSLLNTAGKYYLIQRFGESAIDSVQPIMDNYSKVLECIEDDILENSEWDTLSDVHRVRKELLILKRILLPLHHTLRTVARDSEYFSESEDAKRVSRDLLQHGTNMLDMVEYFISVTSDMMNLHMSSMSNKMNQVATVLAIVASVFLPPSLVAGIYGMNFYNHKTPWNMPELDWDMGYPFALILMIGMSVGFIYYFWKNGWLRVFYAQKTRRRSN